MMQEKTKQILPEWFDGEVYTEGAEVTNPYSGDSCWLNPKELSMYDLIKGCETLIQCGEDNSNKDLVDLFYKSLWWFKDNNPSAYMTLLD
jgi:hypothetical protein